MQRSLKNTPEKQLYYLLADFYEKQNKYSKSEECYQFVINNQPNLIYPYYQLALFYQRTNNRKMWIKYANFVINFNPKIQSNTVEMIKQDIKEKLQENNYHINK